MMDWAALATWMAIAYLVAAIPVGLVIGKIKGVDLRAVGSGNIGATNAVRSLGRGWGLPVFALDVVKAWAPVFAASHSDALTGSPNGELALCIVSMSAFAGHVWPVYIRFKGGKGVSCALGVFAVFSPLAAAASLLMYVQTLVLTRMTTVASLSGVTTMVIFIAAWPDMALPVRVTVVVMAALIWLRHRENLRATLREARERRRAERSPPREE